MMETITIARHGRHPSILALGIKGKYGDKKGTRSITFREGMSMADTAKYLRRLADFIQKEVMVG